MYRVVVASDVTTGKTVSQTIAGLFALNLTSRLEKLKKMNAPQIMIDRTEEMLAETRSGKVKVNGMARKYKVANEEVLELYQADAIGNYYKEGKKKTVLLKMVTPVGTFYYDYYGNRISSDQYHLDANVEESKFRRVSDVV